MACLAVLSTQHHAWMHNLIVWSSLRMPKGWRWTFMPMRPLIQNLIACVLLHVPYFATNLMARSWSGTVVHCPFSQRRKSAKHLTLLPQLASASWHYHSVMLISWIGIMRKHHGIVVLHRYMRHVVEVLKLLSGPTTCGMHSTHTGISTYQNCFEIR